MTSTLQIYTPQLKCNGDITYANYHYKMSLLDYQDTCRTIVYPFPAVAVYVYTQLSSLTRQAGADHGLPPRSTCVISRIAPTRKCIKALRLRVVGATLFFAATISADRRLRQNVTPQNGAATSRWRFLLGYTVF